MARIVNSVKSGKGTLNIFKDLGSAKLAMIDIYYYFSYYLYIY